jgi:hypothetical protein
MFVIYLQREVNFAAEPIITSINLVEFHSVTAENVFNNLNERFNYHGFDKEYLSKILQRTVPMVPAPCWAENQFFLKS